MTTIAFDGRMLAADTLTTKGDNTTYEASKIYHMNGWVAAGAGTPAEIKSWVAHVKKMSFDEIKEVQFDQLRGDNGESSHVIAVNISTGEALISESGFFWPMPTKTYAIGSGSIVAKTAMHLGRTAEEAVSIAIELDASTGGTVECVCIG